MDSSPTVQNDHVLETFRICREETKFESGVLQSRLMTFITSQSFLVSAYAVSMNNADHSWGAIYRVAFPIILSVTGLLLAIQAYPGISGACRIVKQWHIKQNDLLEANPELDDYLILHRKGMAKVYGRTLWFAQTSPWLFAIVWVLLGGLTWCLHTNDAWLKGMRFGV